MVRRAVPGHTAPMAHAVGQFSAAELRLLRDALVAARSVLEAANGAVLERRSEPERVQLHLDEELSRVEAALMLVTTA
jgi:hypothetical protein